MPTSKKVAVTPAQAQQREAHALAWLESRYGKTGAGRAAPRPWKRDGAASEGHAVPLSKKRVVAWLTAAADFEVMPDDLWTWDQAPEKQPKPKTASLEARLDAIDASAAKDGVKFGKGLKDLAVEEALVGAFPEDLAAWVRRHDGSLGKAIANGRELLPMKKSLKRFAFEEELSFSSRWLVMASNPATGSVVGVNFDQKGMFGFGQVIELQSDLWLSVRADSFIDWLEGLCWGS